MTPRAITSGRGEGRPLIYHGTPLTPRAALNAIMPGRAACVSFYRPDDAEAVEAVCPQIMFRQRGIFVLAGGSSAGRRMVLRWQRLGSVFSVARQATLAAGAVGDHTRRAGCAIPTQRWVSERLAVWPVEGFSCLAHGRPDRAAVAPMRALRSRLPRMDWAAGWSAGLSRPNGGGGQGARQSLASAAHAARREGGARLPLRQRGQHQPRTERTSL